MNADDAMEQFGEDVEVDYEADDGDAPRSAEKSADVATGEEIYGDLYDAEGEKEGLLKSKNAALQEQCRDQEATIKKLREKLETLIAEKDEYQEERRILIRNISCLFRTAQEEMTRRDEMMQSKEQSIRALKNQLQAARSQGRGPASPTQTATPNWEATPH